MRTRRDTGTSRIRSVLSWPLAVMFMVAVVVTGCGTATPTSRGPAKAPPVSVSVTTIPSPPLQSVAPTTIKPSESSPTTIPKPPETNVYYAAPVDMTGLPLSTLGVEGNVTGSCESGSDAIGNVEVYRCMAGNEIYDPCWASSAGGVLCMASPWADSVVHLSVADVPRGVDVGATDLDDPWGVQLTSGARCLAAQGAHDTFGSHIVDYYCSGASSDDLELLRGVDRTGLMWTYQTAIFNGSSLVAGPTVSVASAWFAGPAPTDARPCLGTQLGITASVPLSVGGMAWLIFQNDSSSTCSLYGFPGVAVIDSDGNQVQQIARTSSGEGPDPSQVLIPPGGAASAVLTGDPDYPNGTCPTYREVLVTPPNTTTSTPVPVNGLTICANAQINPVGVGGDPITWS